MNPFRALAIWLGGQPWLPRIGGRWIPALDRLLRRLSRGRLTLLTLSGIPELFLIVPGRRSGIIRTTPLLCVPVDGGWLVAGSNWGQPKPPAWLGNLLAADRAEVEYRGRRAVCSAVRLSGDERAEAWQRMLKVWPNYAKYAERTDREIAVVKLQHGPM
ncbi:nitroreductase family deazaflavin-dependent oxidoreductase [Nocardioides speluncae]|uniref:nitroreductase family deazaflavin-dependent oxidoreductase n=1 Tax=Nocardioides speluncae TaxID=2670337 RepID=UPI000D69A75C|nr:nitroreductase family deazaflavin-dependent oxidoreductase [Nocardioides speluncae]